MEIRLAQIVYFWSIKLQNRRVLTAPESGTLPNSRQHPYEAQLDALEGVMCADLMTATLGSAPISSATDLAMLLEQYRTTILEPIEMPVIAQAHRLASRGRTKELIALDQQFLGNHPEWLQLSPASKRFGLDGGESVIPCVEQILHTAAREGVEEVVLGMPHRGRLNVLTRTMGKPYVAVFSEFQGNASTPDDVQGSGDVKYHLGTSSDREFEGGKTIHLSLTANPSHLEAVNPVVLGKVRAKQTQKGEGFAA